MLEAFTARLNKSYNEDVERSIMTECGDFDPNCSMICPSTEEEMELFKQALNTVDINPIDSPEINVAKLKNAVMNPTKTITEAVISTSKSISMTKEDYENYVDMIDSYKKADNENEKKLYVRRFKKFISTVATELRKCNDERPADALIVALVNKLCRLYNIEIDDDKDQPMKYRLTKKLNALAKAMSK